MIKEKQVRKLTEEQLKGSDKFLVDVHVKTGNNILVFIDGDQGVKLQDCIDLSRHIESSLDRDAEDFSLNVSSHGLDQPFRLPRQFKNNEGKLISVLLSDGSKKKGRLVKAQKEGILFLEEPDKKKKKNKKTKQEIQEEFISFEQLQEAKLVISFKNS